SAKQFSSVLFQKALPQQGVMQASTVVKPVQGTASGLGGAGNSEARVGTRKGDGFVLSEVITTGKVQAKRAKVKTLAASSAPKGARYEPGIVSGGDKLAVVREGDKWFLGTEKNAAKIPKQIANQLKGRQFKSFDEFRQTMWKLVAQDPVLSKEFNKKDLFKMQKYGQAPDVSSSQFLGKRRVFEIHHRTPINQGGGVYDIDNLIIVTPK
ncbi:MAG: hypothetical protein NWS20_01845, partial [Rickettsiaceae bacterium]|nr:hypothetical protein [Rickettsiaceae bacterium]